MYIVTTLSPAELGELIREKRVSLNNGKLLFGTDSETINKYFKERVGYQGYVIGMRGRINNATAGVLQQLDQEVVNGNKIIIEAEIDEEDVVRFSVDGVTSAAQAVYFGMTEETIREQLDEAQLNASNAKGVEVLCVPYISKSSQVKVTSPVGTIQFNVEGITFVNLEGGGK